MTAIVLSNGIRQELKTKMALRVKLGLFPIQWQFRFRTLVNTAFCITLLYSCFIYLMINKLCRKWVEFQLVIQ